MPFPFWRSGDAEHKEGTSSTQRKVTPEFLSRNWELRDIQEDLSEYVRYMLRSPVQNFIFQSLSTSLFLNLLFEPDPYSNEYLAGKNGFNCLKSFFSPFLWMEKVWMRPEYLQFSRIDPVSTLRRARRFSPLSFSQVETSSGTFSFWRSIRYPFRSILVRERVTSKEWSE